MGPMYFMNKSLKRLLELIYYDSKTTYMELIAIVVLFGFGILWWWSYLYFPMWTPDGNTYVNGINLVRQGRSPYEHYVFPYPPTIAILGAWITELLGNDAFRVGFRYANLLCGFLVIWGSLYITRWPWLIRLILACVGIFFLPILVSGIENDNLSMLASCTAIMALLFWQRIPIISGIIFGFGLALKPIALMGFFILAAHRSPNPHRKHLITCCTAIIIAGILLAIKPRWFISGFFHPNVGAAVVHWTDGVLNASFFRIISSFGLKISPFLYLTFFLVLSLIYVRRRPLNRIQLLCVACTASLLSLPIVWQHTLLIVLPVLFIVIAISLRRLCQAWRRSNGKNGPNIRLYSLSRLLNVIAGSITVAEANGYGVISNWHPWANGLILMIPLASLILLTGYAVKYEGTLSSDRVGLNGE